MHSFFYLKRSFTAVGRSIYSRSYLTTPATILAKGWNPRRITRCNYFLQGARIHTLNPVHLRPVDYLDLSNLSIKEIHVPQNVYLPQKDAPGSSNICYKAEYSTPMSSLDRAYAAFPQDSRGFLYYRPPPDPSDEGELRFRITPNPDPRSFDHGIDLTYPNGEPWHVPAGRIFVTQMYLPLRRLLLEEGLVTEPELTKWGDKYRITAIHTLDRSRLQSSDHVDLSGRHKVRIYRRNVLPDGSKHVSGPAIIRYWAQHTNNVMTRLPFPSGTEGFLYYHPPMDDPPLDEGHLRFRLTASNDPNSFYHRKDLLVPGGRLWYIPCSSITTVSEVYSPLREWLLQDGLVTEAHFADWRLNYTKGRKRRPVLREFGSSFILNFGTEATTLWVVSETSGQVQPFRFSHPFIYRDLSGETDAQYSLYSGKAICYFENATPLSEDGEPIAVLRLKRILDDFKPLHTDVGDRVIKPPPEEGRIFREPFTDGSPWTMKLSPGSALRALWENRPVKLLM